MINNPENRPLNPNGKVGMNAMNIPAVRASLALQRGVDKNFMIYVTGGLGDAICAEPTIRYMTQKFKDVEFTIASYFPDIYRHLRVKEFIDFKANNKPEQAYYDTHYVIRTLQNGDSLHSQFMPHPFCNVIDYHSIAMIRMELDPRDKNICLKPSKASIDAVSHLPSTIVIHPGRTWPSRTIPASYWNEVISILNEKGHKPIIIGGAEEKLIGTVDVDTKNLNCIDVRGQLSIMQSVALLQKSTVLLSNDSSPIHMAASGSCWIGMVSTVKRPDLITHWRGPFNEFGYKTKNFSQGGLWERFDMNPCSSQDMEFALCTEDEMKSWMGYPEEIAEWALNANFSEILDL